MQSHECSGPDCRRTVYEDSFLWNKRQQVGSKKTKKKDLRIYACSEECYEHYIAYHQQLIQEHDNRRAGELTGRFRDFVPRYVRDHAKWKAHRTRARVSAKELKHREDRAYWWSKKLGNKFFEHIDWDMIDRILLDQYDNEWKAGTCQKYAQTLSMIFQAASAEKIFRASPYASDPLKAQNPGKGHIFTDDAMPVVHRLTREELESIGKFIHIGSRSSDWLLWTTHVATQLAWRAGLRRSEVMGLQWGDVTDSEVLVKQRLVWTAGNKYELKDGSKGGLKERRAPFLVMSEWGEHPDTMKRLLATHRAKIGEMQLSLGGAWLGPRINEPEALVFPNANGTPLRIDACSTQFMKLCLGLDITRTRYSQRRADGQSQQQEYAPRFHDLRHTYGFTQAHRGLPIATVRDLMGHADIQTTNKYFDTDTDRAAQDHYDEQERRKRLP